MICIHNGILVIKKWNSAICNNVGGLSIMLSKVSQAEKDEYSAAWLVSISLKKKSKLTETVDWWLPRTGMQGKWDVVQGYRLSVIR